MNLQTRLKKLETATRPVTHGGLCNCSAPRNTIVYYPGNEPPADMMPSETCDMCGGERRVIKIELISRREEVRA